MALENIVLFKCQRSMHIKNRLYNFRIIEFEILRILATLWLIDPTLGQKLSKMARVGELEGLTQ